MAERPLELTFSTGPFFTDQVVEELESGGVRRRRIWGPDMGSELAAYLPYEFGGLLDLTLVRSVLDILPARHPGTQTTARLELWQAKDQAAFDKIEPGQPAAALTRLEAAGWRDAASLASPSRPVRRMPRVVIEVDGSEYGIAGLVWITVPASDLSRIPNRLVAPEALANAMKNGATEAAPLKTDE
jgi:hypothetical protein